MTKSYGGLTRRSLPVIALICAMGVLGLGSSVASANSIIVGPAPTIGADGSDWKWTYTADLSGSSSDSEVLSGDGFTIYDFNGLVAGSLFAPASWGMSTTSGTSGLGGGFGPSGVISGTTNITFTWTGETISLGGLDSFSLGSFGATSVFSGSVIGDFGAADHGTLGAQTNQGLTLVPTPEPGTLALLGIGLLGTAVVARKRRRT